MKNPNVDIIVSNPPYISREAFRKETTRSVRNWEPTLALVPPKFPNEDLPEGVDHADIFYHRLLVLHSDTFNSQVLIMEVGDAAQARRVAKMAVDHYGMSNHVEIWKDNPNANLLENIRIGDFTVSVRGRGSFRAVALFRFSRHLESAQLLQEKLGVRSWKECQP
jgi:methylase of polypeptide subunit release factors